MKTKLFIITVFVFITFSCNQEKIKKLEEENLKLKKQVELQNAKIKEAEKTKYLFAAFLVKVPNLSHFDAIYDERFNRMRIEIQPEENFVYWKEFAITTNISKITNYNEDKKYIFLDEMTEYVKEKSLPNLNLEFRNDILTYVNNDLRESEKLRKNKSKIIDRKVFVFDSYKEASIFKSNNPDPFVKLKK